MLAIPKRAPSPELRPLMRFEVEEPRGRATISPDGTRIAYANSSGSITIRRLDESAARALPGTEGVTTLAFSPGGQWIAFDTGVAGVPACSSS